MGLCVAFELLAKLKMELVLRFGRRTSGLRNRRSSTETKPAWWARRDLNPHGFPHKILSLTRLPITPRTQIGALEGTRTPAAEILSFLTLPIGLRGLVKNHGAPGLSPRYFDFKSRLCLAA